MRVNDPALENWLSDVYHLLKRKYGLDPTDIDTSQASEAYRSSETPEEFVEWLAKKLDLEPLPHPDHPYNLTGWKEKRKGDAWSVVVPLR